MKHRQHVKAHLVCRDSSGNIKWEENINRNTWHDEGEMLMASAVFATNYANYGATPANLYLGLDHRSAINETDTLTTLNGEELAFSNNYSRQALSTAGTGLSGQPFVLATPGGTITSATVTFTASGGAWLAVTNCFLATHATAVATGAGARLLCSLALSTSRTLESGDSLTNSMVVTISEQG